MRSLLTVFIFLLGSVSLRAQYTLSYSASIYPDQAGGEVTGDATSIVGVWDSVNGTWSYPAPNSSAQVCLTMYDSYGYFHDSGCNTDNEGAGDAYIILYDQVRQLGDYLQDSSTSYGSAPDWSDTEYDSGYYQVPSAPQITLDWINASQPHSVAWAFNVAGQLYSANLQLGSIVQTDTNSGNPWTFYLDQIQYPSGSNLAVMTGYNYGISVPGPQCYVDRSDGLSLPNSYTYTVYDGTRYFINATHTVGDRVTTISYCLPSSSGDYITTFASSLGTVDTTNNPSWTKHGLDTISENNEYSIYNDVLGPDPPDYPTVKSRVLYYNLGTIWIQKQAPVSVCNTVLWLSTTGSGDHQNVYNAGPLGCEALTAP